MSRRADVACGYDALPEMHHAEWWDGACVVTSRTRRHGKVIAVLGTALMAVLDAASFDVMTGVGWRLPDAEFVPDAVLSKSTSRIDPGRKRQLYAAGGLPWHWVVDLANSELIVLRDRAGTFVDVQRLTSGTTLGPVEIAVRVADL